MDYEMITINVSQDMYELVEQYEIAASNERIWAKGAKDPETVRMHEENAERLMATAEMYKRMAKSAETLVDKFMIGE